MLGWHFVMMMMKMMTALVRRRRRKGTLSAAHNHLPVMWFAGSWRRHLLPVTCHDVSNATPETLKQMYPGLRAPAFFFFFQYLGNVLGAFFNTCCKVAEHGCRLVLCHRCGRVIYHTLDWKGLSDDGGKFHSGPYLKTDELLLKTWKRLV